MEKLLEQTADKKLISISEVIVVEGRYDKNTLSQFLDATIIETNGFGVFSDSEKINLLRALGEKRGLIILTDSDGAGFLIRNRIKGSLDSSYIKHAYIPDIVGKERRKRAPSKEGTLGVEGMSCDIIINALRLAGASFEDGPSPVSGGEITKSDLFELGLSGGIGAAGKRKRFMRSLKLPEKLSANAMIDVLNILMTREELFSICEEQNYAT